MTSFVGWAGVGLGLWFGGERAVVPMSGWWLDWQETGYDAATGG